MRRTLEIPTRFRRAGLAEKTASNHATTSPVIAREPTRFRGAAHEVNSLSFPEYL
jgi:hypothetical protein